MGEVEEHKGASGVRITQCPRCGYVGESIDFLFTLRAAAMLVPMSYDALRKFLSRHREEFPPVYDTEGAQRHLIRVLTGRDIREIRRRVLRGPKKCHKILRAFATA